MRKGDEKAWEEFAKRMTDSLQKNKANNSCYGADSSQKISKPNTKCRNLITTTAYFSFPFKRNTNTIIGCFKMPSFTRCVNTLSKSGGSS